MVTAKATEGQDKPRSKKSEPLSDTEAAGVVLECGHSRKRPAAAKYARMPAEWLEGAMAAAEDGDGGIDRWLGSVRDRKPEDAKRYFNAIESARAEAEEPATIPIGPEVGADRPVIILESAKIDDGLPKWTGAAMEALGAANSPPRIFQRAKMLCRLCEGDGEGTVNIQPLNIHALRGELARVAHWGELRTDKKGKRYPRFGLAPRMEVVSDIANLPSWDPAIVPRLDGVIGAPQFRPDGRLITEGGYDAEARVYYQEPPELRGLKAPARPSQADADWALGLIFGELMHDFPFEDGSSRANALGVMLLPFVRPMIDGQTPMHFFESSTEGVGKGKLAKAVALPSIGRDLHSSPGKESDAEWRKSLTSTLVGGSSHIFFDNLAMPVRWTRDGDIRVPIDSPALASALTEPVWRDRVLGTTEDAAIRIRCVWMGAGNNVEWSPELARRIVSIRLLPPCERPYERTGFRHDPLEHWAFANRRDLVRACLILVQRWIDAGKPLGVQPFGSYEAYAMVIGGILEVAGVDGFLENRIKASNQDEGAGSWSNLVRAWWNLFKDARVTSAQIHRIITDDQELSAAFSHEVGNGQPLDQKKRVGQMLKVNKGRVYSGCRIAWAGPASSRHGVQYKLEPLNGSPAVDANVWVDDDEGG